MTPTKPKQERSGDRWCLKHKSLHQACDLPRPTLCGYSVTNLHRNLKTDGNEVKNFLKPLTWAAAELFNRGKATPLLNPLVSYNKQNPTQFSFNLRQLPRYLDFWRPIIGFLRGYTDVRSAGGQS